MSLEVFSTPVIKCKPKTIFLTEYFIIIPSVRAEELDVVITEATDRSAGN